MDVGVENNRDTRGPVRFNARSGRVEDLNRVLRVFSIGSECLHGRQAQPRSPAPVVGGKVPVDNPGMLCRVV